MDDGRASAWFEMVCASWSTGYQWIDASIHTHTHTRARARLLCLQPCGTLLLQCCCQPFVHVIVVVTVVVGREPTSASVQPQLHVLEHIHGLHDTHPGRQQQYSPLTRDDAPATSSGTDPGTHMQTHARAHTRARTQPTERTSTRSLQRVKYVMKFSLEITGSGYGWVAEKMKEREQEQNKHENKSATNKASEW